MWIALFSNSGNELAALCKRVGRKPDVIYCDKERVAWHNDIAEHVLLLSHSEIISALSILPKDTLVTLHGYLRLIPSNAINENTFNVHPGDIVKYPELKGIHPQAKALSLKLPSTGVVIHKVTEEVDDGEIVASASYLMNKDETELSLINNLRDLSIDLWCDFLRGRV